MRAMATRTRCKTSSITSATSSGTDGGQKLVLLSLAAPDRKLLLSGKTLQSLVLLSLVLLSLALQSLVLLSLVLLSLALQSLVLLSLA